MRERCVLNMKDLSIIIPVYNNIFVGDALRSIEEDESIEIIVVDGESKTDTLEVLDKYKNKIDILISEKDKGLYDAMNKGISLASGTWIFTLASDDRLLCNPVSVIKKYKDFDSDVLCGSLIVKDFNNRFYIIKPSLDKLDLECTLCHPGTFFKKSVYEKFGKYNLAYKCAADHEMFLRLARGNVNIKIIPEIITLFSYGGTSTTNPWRAFKEDVIISDEYGILKIKSRANMFVRIIKLYGAKIKDMLHLKHKTDFMDNSQLMKFLENHPEVIKGNLK